MKVSVRIWLAAIILVHLMLGIGFWMHTPYGAAPDEKYHGVYVRHLADEWRLPVFSPENRDDYEAHQPPLYYALGVPFYLIGGDIGVRALSLVLGALSILAVFAAVRTLLPDRERTAIACAGSVALLPMHLALSSSVANDILAELIFGLALLLMTRMLVSGPNTRASATLGLVLGLGLLSKTTCILLFPAALLVYLILWRRGTLRASRAVTQSALMLGVSLAVGGWWLVRNGMLYGDPLAMSLFNEAFTHTARPEFFVVERGLGWGGYFLLVGAWTFASFWGVFGHMNVFMPTWVYLTLAGFSIVTLIASIRPVAALRRDVLIVYAAVVLLVFAAFVRFNLTYFQAQGRYLYPAIIPIALAFVLGVERLLGRGSGEANSRP